MRTALLSLVASGLLLTACTDAGIWRRWNEALGRLSPEPTWVHREPMDDGSSVHLVLAPDESVVYAATTEPQGDLTTHLVVRYRTGGTRDWSRRFQGPKTEGISDRLHAIAVSSERVVTVGRYRDPVENRLGTLLALWAPDSGNVVASDRRLEPAEGTPHVGAVATDGDDAVVVAGARVLADQTRLFVLKYDAAGQLAWVASDVLLPMPFTAGGSAWVESLDIGPDGSVAVCSQLTHPAAEGDQELLVHLFSSGGQQLWRATVGPPAGELIDCRALTVTGDGATYLLGTTDGPTRDGLLLRLAPNGDVAWQQLWNHVRVHEDGSASWSSDQFKHMTVSPGGEVTAVGLSERQVAIVRYAATGEMLSETVSWHEEPAWFDHFATDPQGNVYLTGSVDSDLFVGSRDPDGNLRWSSRYDGPAGGSDAGEGIVVDSAGNVYVVGTSENADGSQSMVTLRYTNP